VAIETLERTIIKQDEDTVQAIRAEGLVRRFGDTVAVGGVDLQVAPGEIYGFLGPNGAGKTTMVRMLVTLISPTEGRAEVAGYDVETHPGEVRLRIGVALQSSALDNQQTGVEILRLQGRLYGLSRREVDRRLDELRDLVDIGEALNKRVKSYSGGMRRRLDLAAALVHSPEVLFLDEPTTGLDPVSRARVWEEVRRLNDELGVTIFLTTQYLEEADRLADRVGIIDRGRIVAEGSPEALKRSVGQDLVIVTLNPDAEVAGPIERLRNLPGVANVESRGDEVFVSTENGAALLAPVAVELSSAGASVSSLTLRTPTLDDVFLDVTGHRLSLDGRLEEVDSEGGATHDHA